MLHSSPHHPMCLPSQGIEAEDCGPPGKPCQPQSVEDARAPDARAAWQLGLITGAMRVIVAGCSSTIAEGAPIIAEADGHHLAGSFPETLKTSTPDLSRFDSVQDAQDPNWFLRKGSASNAGRKRKLRSKRGRSVAMSRKASRRSRRATPTPGKSPREPPAEPAHKSVSERGAESDDGEESVDPPSTAPGRSSGVQKKDSIYWKNLVTYGVESHATAQLVTPCITYPTYSPS